MMDTRVKPAYDGLLCGKRGEIRHFWGGKTNHASAGIRNRITEHVKRFLSMPKVPQSVSLRDRLTMPNIRPDLIRI